MTVKKAAADEYELSVLPEHFRNENERRLYAQDACMLAVTESIAHEMAGLGLSRAQLAERIEKSKGFVSQRLSGSTNLTLKTVADFLWALGLEVRGLELAPIGVSFTPKVMMNEWLDGEQARREVARVETTEPTAPTSEIDVVVTANFALVA